MTQIYGQIFCVHAIRVNIAKMPTLPKAIYRLNAICTEISNGIFHRMMIEISYYLVLNYTTNYSNESCMVPAHKEAHRSVGQGDSPNKPTHI